MGADFGVCVKNNGAAGLFTTLVFIGEGNMQFYIQNN